MSRRSYVNNDSTAIFSTHPSRPFKYGYAYTASQCENYYSDVIENFGIKNGDVVADVGAASGWMDGAFSVLLDSVTFYIEDIDSHLLNQDQFDKVVNYYTSVRKRPQTNKFYFGIGTKRKTNLPDGLFDKIIINNSFHEMDYKRQMVRDMAARLKPGGKIIIHDKFSNGFIRVRNDGCNIPSPTIKEIEDIMQSAGLYLTNKTQPGNSFYNFLTFEKEIHKDDAKNHRRKAVEDYIAEFDKLYDEEKGRDSVFTWIVSTTLKDHLPDIHEAYSSLEEMIDGLGYEYLKRKNIQAAINIFKINLILYPQSSFTYDLLAETYMKNKQYEVATDYYMISLEMDPDNIKTRSKIRELHDLANRKN